MCYFKDLSFAVVKFELVSIQVPILEFCLYAHASRDHQVNAQFHESLVASFFEYKAKIEKQFGKVVRSCEIWKNCFSRFSECKVIQGVVDWIR